MFVIIIIINVVEYMMFLAWLKIQSCVDGLVKYVYDSCHPQSVWPRLLLDSVSYNFIFYFFITLSWYYP